VVVVASVFALLTSTVLPLANSAAAHRRSPRDPGTGYSICAVDR
jgi:hypothetical protein